MAALAQEVICFGTDQHGRLILTAHACKAQQAGSYLLKIVKGWGSSRQAFSIVVYLVQVSTVIDFVTILAL